MISRDALYDFIEATIAAADSGDALFEAVSFRNLRGQLGAAKTVRVECIIGFHCRTEEAVRRELNVSATIQCWVLPATTSEIDMDTATDISFDMRKEIFDAIADDPSLSGGVCDSDFQAFETGYANLGSTRHGVTYLDGLINTAS
jgi:hypothetical protein